MSRPREFSELRHLPKKHAGRVEAARRIRAIRFEDNWQRNQRRIRAAAVWTGRWAVGCIQTGELFRDSGVAARRFKTNTTAIARCCADGRNLPVKMIQFIWLNGPRWQIGRGLEELVA